MTTQKRKTLETVITMELTDNGDETCNVDMIKTFC